MAIYGNPVNYIRDGWEFDRIYDNFSSLNADSDGVFIGRKVLIKYPEEDKSEEKYKYDSTVWEKVLNNNKKVEYKLIAKLNGVTPEFTSVPQAPTFSPTAPYIKKSEGSDTSYNFYTQANFGIRPKVIDTINDSTIDDTNYKSDVKTKWEKVEINNGEYVTKYAKLNGQTLTWVDGKDSASELNAAIYYNKKGFDKTRTDGHDDAENSITLLPTGKSGQSYGGSTKVDTLEFVAQLPSLGNAVADLYDAMYGANRNTFEIVETEPQLNNMVDGKFYIFSNTAYYVGQGYSEGEAFLDSDYSKLSCNNEVNENNYSYYYIDSACTIPAASYISGNNYYKKVVKNASAQNKLVYVDASTSPAYSAGDFWLVTNPIPSGVTIKYRTVERVKKSISISDLNLYSIMLNFKLTVDELTRQNNDLKKEIEALKQTDIPTSRLDKEIADLQQRFLTGTEEPKPETGKDGDIYIKLFSEGA